VEKKRKARKNKMIIDPFDPIGFQPDIIVDMEEPEQWAYKKPVRADHLRVFREGIVSYNHHGIYVSDKEVIHFTGRDGDNITGSNNQVIKTNIAEFLKGGVLEVKVYNSDEIADLYPPDVIVHHARSSIGKMGYNVIFNNCEHFTNWCTLGRFKSRQIEEKLKTLALGGSTTMWGKIGGFIKGLFGGGGSRNTTTTMYEPDKVRVAEIEQQTQMLLAKAGIEKIEVENELKKELMDHFVEVEKAVYQARIEGFMKLSESLAKLGDEMALRLIEQNRHSSTLEKEIDGKIEEMYLASRENSKQAFDINQKSVYDLKEKIDSIQKDDPTYLIYFKQLEGLSTSIIDNYCRSLSMIEEQRFEQKKSNRDTIKTLNLMLQQNSQKAIELIDKSRELIGSTDTAKLLQSQQKKMITDNGNKNPESVETRNVEEIDAKEVDDN
jgi:hypothetical protein